MIDPVSRRVTHLVVRPTDQERWRPASSRSNWQKAVTRSQRSRSAARWTRSTRSSPCRSTATCGSGARAQRSGLGRGCQKRPREPLLRARLRSGARRPPAYDQNLGLIYDRVPKGEVEIRRSSDVYSADEHHLGQVDGLLVDSEAHITHVLLERGHLWGRREVTIPIGAVAKVETDAVTLSLSKDQVGELHRFGFTGTRGAWNERDVAIRGAPISPARAYSKSIPNQGH